MDLNEQKNRNAFNRVLLINFNAKCVNLDDSYMKMNKSLHLFSS